jgi:hypothetical protein
MLSMFSGNSDNQNITKLAETEINDFEQKRLCKLFSRVGKYQNGVLTCSIMSGNDMDFQKIDDDGNVILVNHYYKPNIMSDPNVKKTVSLDLSAVNLASVKDVKITSISTRK